jgi:hypothetical protein
MAPNPQRMLLLGYIGTAGYFVLLAFTVAVWRWFDRRAKVFFAGLCLFYAIVALVYWKWVA